MESLKAANNHPATSGTRLRRFAAVFGHSLALILSEKRCGICAAPIRRAKLKFDAFYTDAPEPDQPDFFKLGLCRKCLEAMPRRRTGYCRHCGEFVLTDGTYGIGATGGTAGTGGIDKAGWPQGELPYGICGRCLLSRPPWQKIYFHGAYQGLLRESIRRLKFGQTLHLAEALGGLLTVHPELTAPRSTTRGCFQINNFAPKDYSETTPYSCIIPVPLHKKRLAERGFNQSALLAAPLARSLNLRLELDLLERSRNTAHQTGLSREMRRRNLLDAFTAKGRADGLRILLFDDVLTTGTTLSSAAACLLRAGADKVDVAVLARTPLN